MRKGGTARRGRRRLTHRAIVRLVVALMLEQNAGKRSAKANCSSEADRVLSEQVIEQRADPRAIREPMQRIEVRLDQSPVQRR